MLEARGLPQTVEDWRRFGRSGFGVPTAAGPEVTELSALSHATVFACVRVLAESVAQLPAILYERDRVEPRKKTRAIAHPTYELLHDQANEEMTAFELFEFLMGSLGLRGNALAWKGYNPRGELEELWPLRWDQTTLERAPGTRELLYRWNPPGLPSRTFPASRIWHVRGLSLDGVQGISPVGLMRETIALGLAAREYGSRFFAQSASPSGVLEIPQELSQTAYDRLKDSWENRHAGLTGAQKTAILEGGAKWHEVSLSQKDAEFLGTVKFNRTEIAGWFRVPPHLIGDLEKATFSNIEHQSIDFVTHALGPWLRRIEQSARRDLLSPAERERLKLEFLVEGMLRGDVQTRYAAYTSGIQSGHMTRNEVRELENRNPLPGLDEPLEPLNMIPVGSGGAEPISIPSSAGPAATPAPEGPAKTEKFDEGAALSPSSVLNGAQVASLVSLVTSVQAGELPRPAALEIIAIAFGIEPASAEKILGARTSRRELVETCIAGLERRGAARRRRIALAFLPVFEAAVARILRAEEREIGKLSAKHLEQRDAESFEVELAELYGEESALRGLMQSTLSPVVDGLTRGIFDEAASEIAEETDRSGLDDLVAVFLSAAVAHHASQSEGRIRELDLRGADPQAAIASTFEEWKTTRPARAAKRETVQQSRAAARNAYAKSGVTRLRWVTSGDSCPFCVRLDGKIVGIDQSFVGEGETWEAEGQAPLVTSTSIAHAPLHKGCDCDIAPAN
jgi:HK97 family phage portal protein